MPDDPVAFPTLDPADLALLEALGTRRSVEVGEHLYRQGDATYDFYVVVSGAVDIVVHSDGTERLVVRHGPGNFLGGDLAERAVVQAEKFGASLTSPCAATALREEQGHLVLRLSDLTDVVGRAVIAATGARYRRLPIDGLERLEGNGVYYAATEMEARLCAGSPVVVVGGGNSAGQAAVFLADSGSPVTVVIRSDDLGKSMSRYLVERIEAHPSINVRSSSQVVGVDGDMTLNSVRVRNAEGEVELACSGLFSLIGADPSSGWLSGCAALDQHGFVLTDTALGDAHLADAWAAQARRPLPFETSRPGLFAVGDLRSGSIKRVAAAVGEGSAAVRVRASARRARIIEDLGQSHYRVLFFEDPAGDALDRDTPQDEDDVGGVYEAADLEPSV